MDSGKQTSSELRSRLVIAINAVKSETIALCQGRELAIFRLRAQLAEWKNFDGGLRRGGSAVISYVNSVQSTVLSTRSYPDWIELIPIDLSPAASVP